MSENTIWVRSALPPAVNRETQKEDGSHPVALWERDDAHPEGEVFIAGPAPVECARTGAVMAAMREGKIVECEAPQPAPVGI